VTHGVADGFLSDSQEILPDFGLQVVVMPHV
jgi:hypothetical protein